MCDLAPVKEVATTAGIEPATYSLGNCCSIQLSYVVSGIGPRTQYVSPAFQANFS